MTRRKIQETTEKPIEEVQDSFEAIYDESTKEVRFELTSGIKIKLKSPKAKQFLLLDSFVKNAPEEYKTESFCTLKLASLCICKYGDKDSVTFDELIDELEVEDIERVVAGLSFFRDKFEHLSK